MPENMDALELLQAQHDDVLQLFEDIEQANGAEKQTLFEELADKLAAHSAIEEKLFYPSVVTEATSGRLLEATEEHLAAKRVLADLLDMAVDEERFDAKLSVLKEAIRHHARDEEEGKLFPLVREEMSPDQLAGLGSELLGMFEELIEREPRMNVPAETREAAELPAL